MKTTVEQLKGYIKEKNGKQDCVFLGIFYKENSKHIGNIKLEPINLKEKKGMMGIIIGNKSYWKKGLGTEAIMLFAKWIFVNLGLEKIEAGAFPENAASLKAFKKAGFSIDRMEPKSVMHKEKMWDNIIMAIKKSDC